MLHNEVAKAFSNGEFEKTYLYLADNVEWVVVGENHFKGKQAVIENCEQVAAYFNSVETIFETIHIIADGNLVAVNGTAEFIKDRQRVSFVDACDVYEFNDNHKLQKITSYCIQKH